MPNLLSEAELAPLHQRASQLQQELDRIILGQQQLTRLVLIGVLTEGHILLEGLPGLGKTELVKALATLSGLSHSRIQFTPDLLPADITGTQMVGSDGRSLHFQPGPLFAQLVLADEINRASPKTQSALLQAMAERAVTAFDTTYDLPRPFFVLATQNPIEQDGTYPLPEAQLDRFSLKLLVTGIDTTVLTELLNHRPDGQPPRPAAVLDADGLRELLAAVQRIVLPPAVAGYIARLINATRPEQSDAPQEVVSHLRWGASPRAAIALAACGRASALLAGKPAVGFEDVRNLAAPVLRHRLIPSYEAGLSGIDTDQIVARLLTAVPEVE